MKPTTAAKAVAQTARGWSKKCGAVDGEDMIVFPVERLAQKAFAVLSV
jgi:hypothetical protein